MTRANCTVVCAVHQPSSQMISQFDDIMVLSQGICIYCGPKSEILATFSDAGFTCPDFYNIAEFGNVDITIFFTLKFVYLIKFTVVCKCYACTLQTSLLYILIKLTIFFNCSTRSDN